MKKLLLLIILFSLILLNCATEQETIQTTNVPKEKCDEPVWNAGDSWRWEARYEYMELTILEADKDSYTFRENSNAGEYTYKVDKIKQKATPISRKGHSINMANRPFATWGIRLRYLEQTGLRFPIYVGKKWTFMVFSSAPFESKVVAYEDVTVRAGTFKAFRIDCFYGGNLSGSYWYSPEVKTAVLENSRGMELVSYKIKQVTPAPAPNIQKLDIPSKTRPPETHKQQTLEPVTPPSSTDQIIVTGTSANIRSGAGNEFPIVAKVKRGDKLILLGEDGAWFNVRLQNNQEGWISNMYAK